MTLTNNKTESLVEPAEQANDSLPQASVKKPFVEPAVSVPVDVLETTSFFQQDTTAETSDV